MDWKKIFKSARDFQWSREERDDLIDMIIDHPVHGEIRFTANKNDKESHGRKLFEMAAQKIEESPEIVKKARKRVKAKSLTEEVEDLKKEIQKLKGV